MNSSLNFAVKSFLSVGVALAVFSNAFGDPIPISRNQAAVMTITGIGNSATGKRKAIIEAAQERIAKIEHPRVCPVFTDQELEALIFDSHEAVVLRNRYSEKSSGASTLGQYTNMAVMKDCEKQAQRILFFWDSHSYDRAKKRYATTS